MDKELILEYMEWEKWTSQWQKNIEWYEMRWTVDKARSGIGNALTRAFEGMRIGTMYPWCYEYEWKDIEFPVEG